MILTAKRPCVFNGHQYSSGDIIPEEDVFAPKLAEKRGLLSISPEACGMSKGKMWTMPPEGTSSFLVSSMLKAIARSVNSMMYIALFIKNQRRSFTTVRISMSTYTCAGVHSLSFQFSTSGTAAVHSQFSPE